MRTWPVECSKTAVGFQVALVASVSLKNRARSVLAAKLGRWVFTRRFQISTKSRRIKAHLEGHRRGSDMAKKSIIKSNQPGATHAVSEWDNPKNKPQMSKGPTPSKAKIEEAGHEIKVNPPAILAKTKKKSGKEQARKQAVAIMLSKARKG